MVKRKIIDYKLAHGENMKQLENEVMMLIEKNYNLYGNPFTRGYKSSSDDLCQAMIKYEEDDVTAGAP